MRSISEEFSVALKHGHLKPLLDRVHRDPDLELFIRESYINVYFKGASILKLTELKNSDPRRYLVDVAPAYVKATQVFSGCGIPVMPGELGDTNAVNDFMSLIPFLKEGVLFTTSGGKREVEFEQLFTRINNRLGGAGLNTEYFVVDRQYVEAGERGSRPDVLGVRWDTRSRSRDDHPAPVLIEVKYGLNSDIQDVAAQVRRYLDQLQRPEKWTELVTELQTMMVQRAWLGLFGPKDSPVLAELCLESDPSSAEVLLLLVDYNKRSQLLRRAAEDLHALAVEKKINIRIAHVGMALWQANTSKCSGTEALERGDSAFPSGRAQGPSEASRFSKELYGHLIRWKAKNITPAEGPDRSGTLRPIMLPNEVREELPHLYGGIRDLVRQLPFKRHDYFNHMASSQAACLNLFLPILTHPLAALVLRDVLPDIHQIDREWLERGFAVEYSGEELGVPGGPIGDKSPSAGTDCDFAIAYRDQSGQRCLWMIEHKLTEPQFTTCGGFRSPGRDPLRHRCDLRFEQLLADPQRCYYSDVKEYRYWELTRAKREQFPGASAIDGCPFKDGMNQLWRNQVLAWSLEEAAAFGHVTFSVVHHPRNTDILKTIRRFQALTDAKVGFFAFDSTKLVDAARRTDDADLSAWADWYAGLYLPVPVLP